MKILEKNWYGDMQCPDCKSTNVLLEGETGALHGCIDCAKKQGWKQGVIGIRVSWGDVGHVSVKSKIFEIPIPKGFGRFFKWFQCELLWRSGEEFKPKWRLQGMYTETFIPKVLIKKAA